eukprot:283800-Chlamydomonas_euryale.AAC.1
MTESEPERLIRVYIRHVTLRTSSPSHTVHTWLMVEREHVTRTETRARARARERKRGRGEGSTSHV